MGLIGKIQSILRWPNVAFVKGQALLGTVVDRSMIFITDVNILTSYTIVSKTTGTSTSYNEEKI